MSQSPKKRATLFVTAVFTLVIPSCNPASGPVIGDSAITKISVPPGPEDLVVDRREGRNRLIVSCRDLRGKRRSIKGSLIAINFEKGQPKLDPLISQWKGKPLQPHGICLSGDTLYVINHMEKGAWEVLQFHLDKNGNLINPTSLGGSPVAGAEKSDANDLTVLPNGDLIVSAFKVPVRRHNRLLHYSKASGKWSVFDPRPPGSFPNGVWADGSSIVTSSAGGVYRYRNNEAPKTILARTGAGDNFGAIEGNPREILLTSHQSAIRFGINSFFPCFRSPMTLTKINLDSDSTTSIRLKNGKRIPINAASVSVVAEGHLWIGQVFGNYLLKIPLDRLEGL